MTRPLLCLAAFLTLAVPSFAGEPGVLTVRDGGNVFTPAAVEKAVQAFGAVEFPAATAFTIVTFEDVPKERRAEYEAAKGQPSPRSRFFLDWAKAEAKERGTPDLFVLICTEGKHVRAIDNRATLSKRDFTTQDLRELQDKFTAGMKAGTKATDAVARLDAHDEALIAAVKYATVQLNPKPLRRTGRAAPAAEAANAGSGIAGYLCIGVAVLLGIWLVVGLFRMMSSGGGGMGGGYGGGGMGGFLPGLMGGMLGAVAGHYLYDNLFNSGSSSSLADGNTGADDFSDSGPADYGDAGGGDYGDAGGDFGGGDW